MNQGMSTGQSGRATGRRAGHHVYVCAMISVRVILVSLLVAPVAPAERRPFRNYTLADGLPSNNVMRNVRDSHGFLWFCTREGLSRFDGYAFTNYGVEQGLPDNVVTAFLESRTGDVWIGTARGLALWNPRPGPKAPMFTTFAYGTDKALSVGDLVEDRLGTIWVSAANYGLLQLVRSEGTWKLQHANVELPNTLGLEVDSLLEDNEGNLWISLFNGIDPQLCRRRPDGRLEQFHDQFLKFNRVVSISQDREGNIWLGSYLGLALLVPHPEPSGNWIAHVYSKWDPGMRPEVGSVFQSSDGRRWIGTNNAGLFQILGDPRKGTLRFQSYDRQGLNPTTEDGDGNFWSGSRRMLRNGLVTYGRADGLAEEDVRSIFEGSDGQLYVVSSIHSRYIHRFDGKRFIAVAPKVPGHSASWDWGGWGWGQTHLQDHLGEWWFATGHGLLHYPKVKRLEDLAHTPPKTWYHDVRDVFRLYEDSRGDIWIGSWYVPSQLLRWERSTQSFQSFGRAKGWQGMPTAFREDRAGDLWIGKWGGGLWRFAQGRFTPIIPRGGFPSGITLSLLLDHAGRIWASTTRSGLVRFDDPTAEHPSHRLYSTKEGLSSNDIRAITEDHFGRIYAWTGRGIDRLDPDTGRIRHYSEADGLPSYLCDHNVAFSDLHGTLWFGEDGLSRLDPEPDRPAQPPRIRITKLRIRGAEYPVSELGENDLSGLVLEPNQDQVEIDFASLNFAPGENIQYQYKLDGADLDWSTPTELRSVNFPHLSSGRYRFLVRAVNSEGLVSPSPASIAFILLPPIWKRWWFLSAVALLIACLVYMAYRYRLRKLLELERVRTRIATDLHDDIGSTLTQIAIMSEVARRQEGHSAEPLERIADLSRGLVDSMSDIVWAINPKRDHFSDLIHRMRRFANDVLESTEIEVTFLTTEGDADGALDAETRRELFLLFKEGINNIARHADCNRVDISVEFRASQFVMKIRDNGQGFLGNQSDGHGLTNMRERARRLQGTLQIAAQPGQGTHLDLIVPLGRPISPTSRVSKTTHSGGDKSVPVE